MKTLAVLSALAAIAIAAPSVEYGDSTRLSPEDFTITQHREKKSTGPDTQKLPEHLEEHTSEHILTTDGSSNIAARTFTGFKKPIIVKKKIGVKVYRDSGEEQSQVDSRESCKQMKLKLCDDSNLTDKVKSASTDLTKHEISEREMAHSIHIAKEAVQTFERDLQRMEHDCAEDNKHRHTTLGSDIQLHEDLEKARQALDHIHRKFKNLDAVTTIAEERSPKDQLNTLKTDEDRMAQWKESQNLHKNVEISRNLEDNFKSTVHNDESKHIPTNKHFKAIIEDIDELPRSTNKLEDGLASIVEDKNRKLEIHSDSLIKKNTANEGDQQKEEKMSRMEEKDMIEKSADLANEQQVRNHNQGISETKDQDIDSHDNRSKFVVPKENDLNLLQTHSRDHIDNNEMLKTSEDSVFDMHARTKLEKEHSHMKSTHENDQLMHESAHVDNVSSSNHKTITRSQEMEKTHEGLISHHDDSKVHLDHDNLGHKTSLLKATESINDNEDHLRTDDDKREDIPREMDLQRSTHLQTIPSTSTSTLHDKKNNGITYFKNHVDHANSELTDLRATSDFHKELLNNMDFIEDSQHASAHVPSLGDKKHMMKNEKSELHERLNVPGVHSNSEHLKTMMRLSDNSHHVNPHLKVASMFDNEQPNFNVQFNSPQDFAQQTNVQDFMPFRATGDLHDHTRLKSVHEKDDMPTELHDPLKVHWAPSENMRMDASSQHFNVEKLTPPTGNPLNDQHLNLNEQIRAQQRWAQAKSLNTQQLSPMNTGLEHLHGQDHLLSRSNIHNMMMHEKSNEDNILKQSSLQQMRGASKMALEYYNPNQWAHNHGAFRSSYGPSMSSSSYGPGGGSSPSSSGGNYGGSAVGVFPNANVGNSAVPILLSCSPSVVSGSLAKTQNSYSAPAYRSRSEDINFLKKRGIQIGEVFRD